MELNNQLKKSDSSYYSDDNKSLEHYYNIFNTYHEKLVLLSKESNPIYNNEIRKHVNGDGVTHMYHHIIKQINDLGTQSPNGYIIDTPKKILIPLKIHQKRTLYEMIQKEQSVYRFTNGYNVNLLCDDVGSGKSLTVLSLIAKHPTTKFQPNTFYSDLSSNSYSDSYHKSNYSYYDNNYYYGSGYQLNDGLRASNTSINFKTNLIIVPHIVYNQWKNYINTQTSLVFRKIDSKNSINDLINAKSKNEIIETFNTYDIVLIKSTMFKEFVSNLEKIFGCCRLKNKLNNYNLESEQCSEKIKYLKSINQLKYKQVELFQELENELQKKIIDENKMEEIKDKIKKFSLNIDNCINKKWENLNINNHIIKTNYINCIKGFYFERIFIDEVDSIKIPAFPYLYSKQIWYISSSVNNLLYPKSFKKWNNDTNTYDIISNGIKGTGFLRDILTSMFKPNTSSGYSNPNKIQYFRPFYTIVRSNKMFIKESIKIPEPNYNYIPCLTPAFMYAIKTAIHPNVLKALNAGDIEAAVNLLGCDKLTQDEIIQQVTSNLKSEIQKISQILDVKNVNLSELNNKIINNNLNSEELKLSKNNIDNLKISIKNYNIKKNDLENKLKGVETRLSNINEKDCPVCYLKVTDPCISPCCKNVFCFECLTTCIDISKACPHCNSNINLKDINILVDNKQSNTTINKLPTKLEMVIKLIMGNEKSFIIFSEYDGGLSKIKSELESNNLSYDIIKGSSSRINNIINNFKSKKFRILLLNAQYSGAGLNLEFTDEIIIFHRMSKDLECQVTGRAQRTGRTTQLVINYLCYENEYKINHE